MINQFTFLVGLPASGKSTYLKNYTFTNDSEGMTYESFIDDCVARAKWQYTSIRICADDFKKAMIGYNESEPSKEIHEESVQLVKEAIYEFADEEQTYAKVLLDGGGINNHYNVDIIEHIREHCPNCIIRCIFFDTPIEVCLKRMESRGRKVPIDNIYEKNLKLTKCVRKYAELVDEFIRVDYYKNRYILLDMDGTIASYGLVKRDMDNNADFVNAELFLHLRPVQTVIDFVKEHFDMNNVFIVTACANSIAWEEKNKWLDKYFPEIKNENRYFCGNKDYKHVFVKHLCIHNKWKLEEVTLIDDYHHTIEKCHEFGINCLHPSNISALVDQYAIFG